MPVTSRSSISARRDSSTRLLMQPLPGIPQPYSDEDGGLGGHDDLLLGNGRQSDRRQSTFQQTIHSSLLPFRSKRNRIKCLILSSTSCLAILMVIAYSLASPIDEAEATRSRLVQPFVAGLQKLQDSATKFVETSRLCPPRPPPCEKCETCETCPNITTIGSPNGYVHATSLWSSKAVLPETRERLEAEGQPVLNKKLADEVEKGWSFQEDELARWGNDKGYTEPTYPPVEGYGALSRTDNPWRERFLVPTYACNEQETGSQMHVRQLLHLAKALNRTLVLPNWGFGIPTISNCHPYSFDTIYETESTNSVGLWSVPYPTWKEYVENSEKKFDARISVVFFRDTHRILAETIGKDDETTLKDACIDSKPFDISDPPIYVATNQETTLSYIIRHLRETDNLSTLFVHFNHYSDIRIATDKPFPDPLLQIRPKEWGFWVGAPWPQWNYSTGVHEMFKASQSRLPKKYAALQWRTELMPANVLKNCSDLFADSVIAGMRSKSLNTIYIASDVPLTTDRKSSKSASFNIDQMIGAQAAMKNLMQRLKTADVKVMTWNDVKLSPGDPQSIDGLADTASGIFDKLILGDATWLWAANPYCGMHSSFLGTLQTLRQDRIGDPKEEDWEKLEMSWVGEPITQRFWWHIKGGQIY